MTAKRKWNRKKVEVALTFLGTFLIVTTFYIHGVKLEEIKELRDRIRQAQLDTLIHTRTETILFYLKQYPSPPFNPQASTEVTLWENNKSYVEWIGYERSEMYETREILKILASSLDEKRDYLDRIHELELQDKRIEEASIDLATYDGGLGAMINHGQLPAPSEAELKNAMKAVEEKAEALKTTWGDFLQLHGKLVTRIDGDVKSTSEAAEKSYKELTYKSYFFYGLGFVIGFIGKLYGI